MLGLEVPTLAGLLIEFGVVLVVELCYMMGSLLLILT